MEVMDGVRKMNEYLRHLEAKDLPDAELAALKTDAARACADDAREWGDDRLATGLDEMASRASV